MKIIIIGAGEVGFYLAQKLSHEKHDLALIDSDPQKCLKVQEALDISVLEGHGASQEVLKEAGIDSADMLIAASAVDEINILACLVAAKCGVKLKIARVRSQDYYSANSVFKPQDLGVDLFIHPEEEVTEEITRLLLRALASEVVEFAEGNILVLGIKIDRSFPFLNSQLKDVGTPEDRMKYRIVAIGRGDKTIIPSGEDYLNKDDQVFVATHAKDLQRLLTMTGRADQKLERIMVLGGGKIGLRLAGKLEQMGREVTVVESNKDKSVQAAGRLKRSMVVEADAMEVDALAREGILNMDAVVAVTGDDEVNIISCLLAKHLGVRKTIALVNRTTYLPLLPVIGIDSSVNIRISTANAIMRLIRGGGIVSIGLFHGIEAEAIEAEITIKSKLSGKELRKIKLPEGCLVAAVVRSGTAFIPHGDSLIEAGDKIIIFALPSTIRELENRFL